MHKVHIQTTNKSGVQNGRRKSIFKAKEIPPDLFLTCIVCMWTKFPLRFKWIVWRRIKVQTDRSAFINISNWIKYWENKAVDKMSIHSQPSILVRLVHSVPHINVTLDRVNSTFDPRSVAYKEVSITIAVSISLFCVWLLLQIGLTHIGSCICSGSR